MLSRLKIVVPIVAGNRITDLYLNHHSIPAQEHDHSAGTPNRPMGFENDIEYLGYCIHPQKLDEDLTGRLRKDSLTALEQERQHYVTEGTPEEGRVLFCPKYGGSFLDILEDNLITNGFQDLLGPHILYTMTTSFLPPNGTNQTSSIHRDANHNVRSETIDMAVMILLDDFTDDNGATYFLAGSHLESEKPEAGHFYKHAVRLNAPKGTVCFFNPLIWHASGINHTDRSRGCLLIEMVKPWMKQRFQIDTILPDHIQSSLTEKQRKILGLDSLPPKGFKEYFQNRR